MDKLYHLNARTAISGRKGGSWAYMQTIFTSMEGLKKGLKDKTMKALDQTTEELYNKLLEFIEQDVYSLPESDWYVRSKQILNAFVIEKAKENGIGIRATSKIDFDDKAITWEPSLMQHGNNSQALDSTYFAFGVLTGDEVGGSAFPQPDRENYWEDFLKWADEHYMEIFNKYMGKP